MRILSWNVNGLHTTLKDAAARHSSVSNYFSNVLAADIICFQEAKIQEEKLEKWMACVPGYESFWAFSKDKKGYSGVVTYVKEEILPLDAKANCFGEFDDPLLDDFANEGRLIQTDHGSFMLINVYAPNAGDKEQGRPRLNFKLSFLKALRRKCDELVRSGRHILLLGDLNIPHKDKDVHKKWNVTDLYSADEIGFMDALFDGYVDLFRHFHPNEEEVFSVWNQKKEARMHNEGLRIDYAACDREFLPQVSDTEIIKMYPKHWSDHAAVVTTLREQPVLPPHPKPTISSSNMQKFMTDTRQKRLTSLFSAPVLKGSRQAETANADAEQEPLANSRVELLDVACQKRDLFSSSAGSPATKVQKLNQICSSPRTSARPQKNQKSLMDYVKRGDG